MPMLKTQGTRSRPKITGVPAVGAVGVAVNLDSSVIDFFENTAFEYAWQVEFNSVIVASGNDADISFTPLNAGNYVVRLTVTAAGRGAGTDELTLYVNGPPAITGLVPMVTWTNHGGVDVAARGPRSAMTAPPWLR